MRSFVRRHISFQDYSALRSDRKALLVQPTQSLISFDLAVQLDSIVAIDVDTK